MCLIASYSMIKIALIKKINMDDKKKDKDDIGKDIQLVRRV